MSDLNSIFDEIAPVIRVGRHGNDRHTVTRYLGLWGFEFADHIDEEVCMTWSLEREGRKLEVVYEEGGDLFTVGLPSYSLTLWEGDEVLRHGNFPIAQAA